MKGFAKRGNRKGEKGFTLVELLIVFTLLSVLAAIMIPNVSGLIGYGHTQAAEAELSIVQTAMDSMMAAEDIAAVTANGGANATKDMSKFPDTTHPLYNVADADHSYLRNPFTTGNYTNLADGKVTQTETGY